MYFLIRLLTNLSLFSAICYCQLIRYTVNYCCLFIFANNVSILELQLLKLVKVLTLSGLDFLQIH